VVPTATVKVIGVNMKLLISTVDPPAGAAEPLGAVDCAGAGGGAPPLSDPGPQPDTRTSTASNVTRPNSRRRGRREDLHEVSDRSMSASVRGDAGRSRLTKPRQANPPGAGAHNARHS
jgi:hypothetical protein